MKLKLDDKGNAVLQDGHPVYIHDNGSEAQFDAKAAHVQIATLSREAGERRTALKVAEEKLAAFGDLDPAAALKATAFAASLDGKKVLDDEGLQKVISAALKPVQDKLTATETALQQKDGTIHKMMVGDKIKSSAFLEKTVYTPSDAERLYGDHFKIEDGKMVPYDANGAPIYSAVRAGELADVDEALAHIIGSRPDKDSILRATGSGGAGSNPGQGGKPQGRTMTRAEYEQTDPYTRGALMKEGVKISE